ncbi:MAG: glycine betaine/L-proline ABC transporter ATP-binding protein [Thermodesulfobacteriota bacterium]|nr:glycine betaine/L-proline ABC transporter ATP-binding protein [Thermodesulfobacteriota bacterium]
MKEKIVVQNLYKVFGKHPEKGVALSKEGHTKDDILKKTGLGIGVNNASFVVNEGEILVVMGLSGSGKSTLVRCINRLIEPTAGKVFLDGDDVTAMEAENLRVLRQQRFGMVFQHFGLFPRRSVIKNVEYGLEIQKVDPGERRDRAMQALEQVGLKGWEDYPPSQLSGGMQQRVGLARALALDPEVLLMDEAFSALDPLIRRDMQDELIKLQEKMHKTIIFISHDLDEALKLGDRIVLMKDGLIVQQGTGEEILTNPATRYVEKFVEDVDMTKVITAQSVMKNPQEVASLKNDGPRAALHKMGYAGISSIFVQDRGRLKGIVYADDVDAAIKRGDKDLSGILNENIVTVALDTPANKLFDLIVTNSPLAVVDDKQELAGVIIKGALLDALAQGGQGDV